MSHYSSTISTIDSFRKQNFALPPYVLFLIPSSLQFVAIWKNIAPIIYRVIDSSTRSTTTGLIKINPVESHDAERLLQQPYQVNRGEVAMFEEMKRECNRIGLNEQEVLHRWEEKINLAGMRGIDGGALLGEPAKRFREIKLENNYCHSHFEIVCEINNHVRYLNAHWASATLEQRKHRLNEIKKLQNDVWDLRDELDYECRGEGFDWDLMNARLKLREVPLERLHGEAKKEYEKLESNAGTDRVVQPRAEFVARSRRE
ncbi:hypothetical protein JCM5353_001813 [Sporobolomyces roseus]